MCAGRHGAERVSESGHGAVMMAAMVGSRWRLARTATRSPLALPSVHRRVMVVTRTRLRPRWSSGQQRRARGGWPLLTRGRAARRRLDERASSHGGVPVLVAGDELQEELLVGGGAGGLVVVLRGGGSTAHAWRRIRRTAREGRTTASLMTGARAPLRATQRCPPLSRTESHLVVGDDVKVDGQRGCLHHGGQLPHGGAAQACERPNPGRHPVSGGRETCG